MAQDFDFLQAANITTDLTTYTFAAQNFGAAAADRYLVVVIQSRKGGASTTITGVTIGGITATEVVQRTNNVTNTDVAGIFIAAVPTGTSGDVVITFGAGMARCGISLFRGTGMNPTPYDTDSSVASDPTCTLNIPADGAAVAGGITAASSSAAWTGLTERSDAVIETFITATSASDEGMSLESNRTITIDFGTSSETVGVFASFEPSAVNTNSERDAVTQGQDTANSERSSVLTGGVTDARTAVLEGELGADNDYLSYMQNQTGNSWASAFKAHTGQNWMRGVSQDIVAQARDFEVSRLKMILHWDSSGGGTYSAPMHAEIRTAFNGTLIASSINEIDIGDVDTDPGFTEVWFYFERGIFLDVGVEYNIGIYGDEADLVLDGGDLEAFYSTANPYGTGDNRLWQERSADQGSSWGWIGGSDGDLYFALYQWGKAEERTATLTGFIPNSYSREFNAALPTDSDTLSTVYDSGEEDDVQTDDDVFVSQASTTTSGYVIHQHEAVNPDFAQQSMTVAVKAKATLDTAVSTVYLQVWNYTDEAWENLDSESTADADEEFSLGASISANLGEYYDVNFVAKFRVYQHV